MYSRMDGTWQPLFSIVTLDKAINGLKTRKCRDEGGLVSEVVQSLGDKGKDVLLELFEARAADTSSNPEADLKDSWHDLPAILIEKSSGACTVDDFRPIHILYVLQKIYLRCLYLVVSQFWVIEGLIQVGARSGHCAIEVIHCLRSIIEKCIEWDLPYVILALDLKKAFDSISSGVLLRMADEQNLPLRIRFALYKEIITDRFVRLNLHGMQTDPIHMQSGLRQGGPESSYLFAFILSRILGNLSNSWRSRGVGFGFGPFGGEKVAMDTWRHEFQEHLGNFDCEDIFVALIAFMDDTYLIAGNYSEAQLMLDELVGEFARYGLVLSLEKVKMMSENVVVGPWECSSVVYGGCEVEKVPELKVLGGKIAARGDEAVAFQHRISAAWATYGKWKHVLESEASIGAKISFWQATVGRSLLYNLVTCRPSKTQLEKLAIVQRNMVRRMLRLKRRPITLEPLIMESWLDWQKRSLRRAKLEIQNNQACIVQTLTNERDLWARHISRFGWGGRPQHILKCILTWRNASWWEWQHFYNAVGHPFLKLAHSTTVGVLRRWEWHLPKDWISNYARASLDSSGISCKHARKQPR